MGDVKELFEKCVRNYNQLVKENKFDKVIGRELEIDRLEEILSRKKKNNAILVGSAGVGKTSIIEGLAQRIVSENCSPTLIGKEILEIDITGLVSDSKFRGEFEKSIKMLLKEIEKRGNVICFMDEIHTLKGSGSTSGDSNDGANMLKPALSGGTLQLIGATTNKEYNKTIGKDSALERRFQKVIVNEPDKEGTLVILNKLRPTYEKHHNVVYNDAMINEIIDLTDKFITNRNQPDKSIDVLDEIGAMVRTRKNKEKSIDIINLEARLDEVVKEKNKLMSGKFFKEAQPFFDEEKVLIDKLDAYKKKYRTSTQYRTAKITVENKDLYEIISRMSGIPVDNISREVNAKTDIKTMEEFLTSSVIGQNDAVKSIIKHVQKTKTGLKRNDKPASFFFLGSSGCGKTLLSKKLTEYIFGDKKFLVRVNMNEYADKHTVSRIIGAPPGYTGHGEGGELTNKVKDMPYCVILLDEVEKAHPDVLDLFLQVLDEGILTDSNGEIINFKNAIIILTSNIGTKNLKDFGKTFGFNKQESTKDKNKEFLMKELEKSLKPEVINRLGEIVVFNELSKDDMKDILNLYVKDLADRLKSLGYSIELGESMVEHICKMGLDPKYGARKVERVFNTLVEDEITEHLLENIKKGSTFHVDYVNNKSEVKIKK